MNINEVVSKYLYECAKPENKGGYLPDIETVFNVKYDYTGEQSIFDRAEKIILENGLLDKEEGGRPCRSTPNTKVPARKPQRITPEDNPKGNPLNHNVNVNVNVNVNK